MKNLRRTEASYVGIFGDVIPIESPKKSNPCIGLYGPGPTNTKCKNCIHFLVKRMGNKYFKCDLRNITAGPGTDHRANWPTCGKYEEKKF